MEAEDGFSKQNKIFTAHWDGDWESYKQKFEATADLNGLNEAVKVGQLIAEVKISWPAYPVKDEASGKDYDWGNARHTKRM